MTGKTRDGRDDFIYICVNSHWENHRLHLPALPDNHPWKLVINTDFEDKSFIDENERPDVYHIGIIPPRSVLVYNAII